MLHMCSGIASREGEEATPRPNRRRRDKSGGIRHGPDPQQRTPPLVGGGGDPERLHGLARSTTTLLASMIGGHAPIRSSGLGRGT